MTFPALILAALLFAAPSHAQDTPADTAAAAPASSVSPADPSYRFAPDFCDFEVAFPETPAITEKCIPGSGCYEVNSYTMVYDLHTTVDVTVTCNPSTPAAYEKYTDGVMKAALAGMIDNQDLTNHETKFQQLENARSASLTGTGRTGMQDKIYTAQLWIGKNSVFTIQAELIGGEHAKADRAFSDILISIKGKDGKQIPRPKKATLPQQNNQ